MNIPKAIELLTTMKHICRNLLPPDEQDALQLLIEAGKCIQKLRTYEYFGYDTSLPGETEE